ncbi:DUF2147 domain-containing protein [Phenylobacterium sp.]|uniref:DUF2147 domain-containing protein n=1 Tax=Phenylobacterium sp. TaxID=1871053 RepID=UPI00121EE52D|nr:DUF2147 domain-containing protein [Phenylobacterium sp.]THD54887.1 MAG: DUF2147 domain-containing protein [Phenylobacterium sp.]
MNRIVAGIAGLAAVLLAVAHGARAAPGDQVFGVWLTQAKDGKVRIAPCANDAAQTCGVILSGKAPDGQDARLVTDIKNPDPALRSRPIVGLQIISGFRRDGEGGWTGGRIYDPVGGKTYKAKMGAGPNGALKVAGCVLFFCRAETWTRVE